MPVSLRRAGRRSPRHDQVLIRFPGTSTGGRGDALAVRAALRTVSGARGRPVRSPPVEGSSVPGSVGAPADVVVAMTPAALRAVLDEPGRVRAGALVVVDSDGFTRRALNRAGYPGDPLRDGTLDAYDVHAVRLTTLTRAGLAGLAVSRRQVDRASAVVALGLISWMFAQDADAALRVLARGAATAPLLVRAQAEAFRTGYSFGRTAGLVAVRHDPGGGGGLGGGGDPDGAPGNVSGTAATALGLLAGARRAGTPLFAAGYPMPPAAGILAELARGGGSGALSFEAEDEADAIGAAVGAAFGGSVGAAVTSGPGLALMSGLLGTAMMAELPVVVVDVGRAGPGIGTPARVEQMDLARTLSARIGGSPLVVLAPSSPADCFSTAAEAVGIAVRYLTPVVVLSDVTLVAGRSPAGPPRRQPSGDQAAPGSPGPPDRSGHRGRPGHQPLAGPWAVPERYEQFARARAAKIERLAASLPSPGVDDPLGPDGGASTLVLGWGPASGALAEACRHLRAWGIPVARAHLRYLNPLPSGIGEVLRRYRRVIVPEPGLGGLAGLLPVVSGAGAISLPYPHGTAFRTDDLATRLREVIVR